MKNILKILALSMVVGVSAVSLNACTEDDTSERDKPEIFTQLERLLPDLDSAVTQKNKANFVKVLDNNKDSSEMRLACKEYGESFKIAKSAENLASNWDNSGYYKAMYILLNNLDRDAQKLEAEQELVNFFIGYPGCDQILTNAKDGAKDR